MSHPLARPIFKKIGIQSSAKLTVIMLEFVLHLCALMYYSLLFLYPLMLLCRFQMEPMQ